MSYSVYDHLWTEPKAIQTLADPETPVFSGQLSVKTTALAPLEKRIAVLGQ